MKRTILALVALAMIVVPASVGFGQGGFSVDMPDERVTIEASILWPIYPGGLVLLRAALPATGTGQALVGIQGQLPEFRETEGTFHNVNLHLGWRQHFGLGFHADAKINAGWGHIEDSAIDGRDYDSFDVELMAAAGWRVSYNRLHLLLQPAGFGYVAYKSNPWPIEGQGTPRTEGPFYVGNVIAGLGL